MSKPAVAELVLGARDRFIKAELAVRDAGLARDIDPALVEYYKAMGALDAVEDQWQAQMASKR